MLTLDLPCQRRSRWMRWRRSASILICVVLLLLYNEFVHYYIVLFQCHWPSLEDAKPDGHFADDPLYAMVLSDTHLLGSREGHWFDKLRREWQMERSFQASLLLHRPDTVFVLGDLFDEGKWCDDAEFSYHVTRFRRMFRTSSETELVVAVGNHDIGFHYMADEHKRQRFARAFNTSSVQLLTKKNNIFVLLNSMAFEGDGCSWCREAEDSLKQIVRSLDCTQGRLKGCPKNNISYSRPILLQHFPLYRKSDSHCSGPDSAGAVEKELPMKPKWNCLSKEISDQLLDRLKPRLILSGHTHHFCYTEHGAENIPEWSLSSFSWRNKNNPSFLLLVINSERFAISKCYLPAESTVLAMYVVGAFLILVWAFFDIWSERRKRHQRLD